MKATLHSTAGRRRRLGILLAALAATCASPMVQAADAPADGKSLFKVKVDAGAVARTASPVSVAAPPLLMSGDGSMILTADDGSTTPGQLVSGADGERLWFVVD
ncbi:MAG: hypothetical protein ACRC1K_14560, partial [Planctomycetia bacterium]